VAGSLLSLKAMQRYIQLTIKNEPTS